MRDKIFELRSAGHNNKQIAQILSKSESTISYYTSPGYKERNVKNKWKRRRNLKEKLVVLMGGKCKVCSYDRCLGALEFHHLDPSQKDPNFKSSTLLEYKMEVIEVELKKCALLCCRCHREVHAGLISL